MELPCHPFGFRVTTDFLLILFPILLIFVKQVSICKKMSFHQRVLPKPIRPPSTN